MAYISEEAMVVLANRLNVAVNGALDAYEDGAPHAEIQLMVTSSWVSGFLAGLDRDPTKVAAHG